MSRIPLLLVLLLLGCPGKRARTSGDAPATLDALATDIDRLGAQLTLQEWTPGLVVGLVRGDARWVRGYGRLGPDDDRVPDGATAFEIGSVTKVFNALLAADAAARGELTLDWSIDQLLPPDVVAPSHAEGPIRLRHLATHTSGLPRMPDNFAPADVADPFADYDAAALYAFLGGHELAAAPGAAYSYSNLGAGLLGHLVAAQAGGAWESVLTARVLEPLALPGTASSPLPGQSAATGHDGTGPVSSWAFAALAGAGDLTSTADDMLAFLQAQITPPAGPLGDAIRATQADQRIPGAQRMGLGWHLAGAGDPLRWHNGETAGFHSYVAVDPDARFGVVVLANQAGPVTDALGAALVLMLRGQPWALELPVTVPVAQEALDAVAGDYPLAPEFLLRVRAADGKLFVQATGQPELRVFPTSATEFHYRVVDARLEFTLDPQTGRATSLVLHQGGRALPADRVEMAPPAGSQAQQTGDERPE